MSLLRPTPEDGRAPILVEIVRGARQEAVATARDPDAAEAEVRAEWDRRFGDWSHPDSQKELARRRAPGVAALKAGQD